MKKKDAIPKVKSKRQAAFLLSKGSPLEPKQQEKLLDELHVGKVKVEKGPKKPPKEPQKQKFGKATRKKAY